MYESPITTGAGIAGLFWVSGTGALVLIVLAALLVLIGYGLASAVKNREAADPIEDDNVNE